MLTNEQKNMIYKYVDENGFNIDKLIRYLDMHEVVGYEVFSYCIRQSEKPYFFWWNKEGSYEPLPVDTFVRRIPFFFFQHKKISLPGEKEEYASMMFMNECQRNKFNHKAYSLEDLFVALEYAFYDMKLPLDQILSYWYGQSNFCEGGCDLFFIWYEYLQMCEEQGRDDFFPERLISAYNQVIEAEGEEPIIYTIEPIVENGYAYFERWGNVFAFYGRFPCDENGNPVMRWIGIEAKNVASITTDCERSGKGSLKIEVKPNSAIDILDPDYADARDPESWYQSYAGPLLMEFDYTELRRKRKQLGLTQQEVADAVGAAVRTYQKWENGITSPDGHYLIRLMNWLDISSVQDITKFI